MPEEDYFIVVNHMDVHMGALLLYQVIRHENKAPIMGKGTAEISGPEISVECMYQVRAIYDVQWRLRGWNDEGNGRREMEERQRYETVSYEIPIW